MKIAVDPGHGMSNSSPGVFDPGAEHVSRGVKFREADTTLNYGLVLKDVLRARGIEVFMTRENATDPAPVGRRAGNAERANCNLFISLHLNDSDSASANGLEVLFRRDEVQPFAQAMHDALIAATGLTPRNTKKRLDLAVLKFDGPAILIELGFISNERDLQELLDTHVRSVMCETITDVAQRQARPAHAAAPGRTMRASRAAAAAAAASTGMSPHYHLPAFARDLLGPASGVPWSQAKPISGMNFYSGIVTDSFHQFPSAVFYECKFAIDNDGVGGNEGGDPHHRSDTSLHDTADAPLDARFVPYIVLPKPSPNPSRPKWSALGIELGDLGVCFFKDGRSCAAILGDKGPNFKLGEGSMEAARELGINPDPNVGGIGPDEVPPGVIHIVFPNSRNLLSKGASGMPRTADTIDTLRTRAMALLDQFKQSAAPTPSPLRAAAPARAARTAGGARPRAARAVKRAKRARAKRK